MCNIDKISDAFSSKMANMSFACACMIVLFHATPASFTGSFTWWICHLVGREGICMIAVPWFFFSSGFFLSGHLGECAGWWKREVSKRIRSLIIPFYIWMVISLVFGVSIWYMKTYIFQMPVHNNSFSMPVALFLLKIIGLHPFVDIGIFWYMRCLFFLVLISPVLQWLTHWKWTALTIFSCLHLIVSWCFTNGYGMDFYFLFDRFTSIRGVVYFFLGIIIRSHISVLKYKVNIAISFLLIAITLLFLNNIILLSGTTVWQGVFEVVLVPFFLVGIFGLMTENRLPRFITGSSFPMFLMHNMLLSLSSLGFKFIGLYGIEKYSLIMMFSRAAIAIGFSIVISRYIHRCFPRVSMIIFGGR